MNTAREATAREEGPLVEEQVARAATTALLPEAHEAHTQRYGERDAHAIKREEAKRQKAHEGAQGSQCQHETEGVDNQEGRRRSGRRTDTQIHLLTSVDAFRSIIVIGSWGRKIRTPLLGRRKT